MSNADESSNKTRTVICPWSSVTGKTPHLGSGPGTIGIRSHNNGWRRELLGAERVEALVLVGVRVGQGRSQRGADWPLRLHPKTANGQSIQGAFQKQLACQDVLKKGAS